VSACDKTKRRALPSDLPKNERKKKPKRKEEVKRRE
jgi:hypothetical protein